MYWSTMRMMGRRVFSAAMMSSRTRPSVVSVPARLTLISRTPVRFWVPAKNSSPAFLSAGNGAAGAEADDIADRELAGRDFFLCAALADAAGLGGCELDERFDGVARAL